MAFFGYFRQKWAKMPIFRKKCPVATGLKSAKMAKKGHFPKKSLKTPAPRAPRGLLLHQPLAAGPCPRPGAQKKGIFPAWAGRGF